MLKSAPMRLLCFDFGLRYIGVAVGQTLTCTATELNSLKAKNGSPDWQQLSALIKEWQPDALILGLPINMDGSPSPMSKKARKFGYQLKERFALPCYPCDERLSSFEAKGRASAQGHDGDFGKNPIDSLAAQVILESWLQTYNQGEINLLPSPL